MFCLADIAYDVGFVSFKKFNYREDGGIQNFECYCRASHLLREHASMTYRLRAPLHPGS